MASEDEARSRPGSLERADRVLAARLGLPVRAARRFFAEGRVRLGGRRIAKGAMVDAGADLVVDETQARSLASVAQTSVPTVSLSVVFEDAHVLALNKPAGMPCHPLREGEQGTLAHLLIERYPECALASPNGREGGLAHRLDTGTSGLILAARSRSVWEALRKALSSGDCEKTYLALVLGSPPAQFEVALPIGRGGPRGGRAIVGGGRSPLPARTTFVRVARVSSVAPLAAWTVTLVRATLTVGRMHQVRAHLSHAGFPIVGDTHYGGPDAQPESPGFCLHAESIRFCHPVTATLTHIVAPPPGWA